MAKSISGWGEGMEKPKATPYKKIKDPGYPVSDASETVWDDWASDGLDGWGASIADPAYTVPSSSSVIYSSPTNSTKYKRCADTHPPLPLGDGLFVYGGSCSHPQVLDADIYIGFDGSMRHVPEANPWHGKVIEVRFMIPDGQAPANADEFRRMIEWTVAQIKAGKKVHAGCIGGHGRTGTFLSALVKTMTGNADASTYVRENYCKKVIETQTQVDFLAKEYGVKKVDPYKAAYTSTTYAGGGKSYGKGTGGGVAEKTSSGKPMSAVNCIWGKVH